MRVEEGRAHRRSLARSLVQSEFDGIELLLELVHRAAAVRGGGVLVDGAERGAPLCRHLRGGGEGDAAGVDNLRGPARVGHGRGRGRRRVEHAHPPGEPRQLLRVGHRERGVVGPLGADLELLLLGDAGPVPEPRGGNLGVHQLDVHFVVHVAHQRQDLGQELRRGLLRVRHELVPVLANLHRVLMFVGDPSVVEHGHLIEQRVVLVDVLGLLGSLALGCELGGVLLLGHILQHALHRVLLRDDCVELLLEELAL
mmetsp:Transcript_10177/g.41143  ORF Transcript_10177/g.41143 Transcript_10177/m.41143 type:complete len:255 (-) Transcript_10177:336-1100(-)